jgi:glycosyltransferase involved in cell wall biosynthesis
MTLSLTLVVPCYREAARLRPDRFLAFLDQSDATRLLFVDDGSPDETLQILTRMAVARPDRVEVLPLDRNVGKGEAVRRGLLHAMDRGTELVGFWDADLATPLALVEDFRVLLARHPEVRWVLGSRWRGLGHRIERNALRHYVSRIFATVVSALLQLPVYDSQCGAKVFRVDPQLTRLLEAPFVSRWVFDVELLARLVRDQRGAAGSGDAGLVELPLAEWIHDGRSHLHLTDFARAGVDLFRIWHRYLR